MKKKSRSQQPSTPSSTSGETTALAFWSPVLGGLWVLVFTVLFYSLQMPNTGFHRLDLIQLLPELIWQNLVPPTAPGMPAGWEYLSQRLWMICVALFIVLSATSAGRLLFRGVNLLGKTDRLTEVTFTTGVGFSLISLQTLFWGVFGLLDQVLFVAVLSIILIVDITLHWRSRTKYRRYLQETIETESISTQQFKIRQWVHYGCAAVCLMFLGCMLLGALLPSVDFDVKEYHLQGPKEFYLAGQVTFLPHNVYTSFPFLTEMLSLCGMVICQDWLYGALVGKAVLMCFAPLTALGIFSLTKRISGDSAAWFAVVFFLTTPWITRISIIAYTEGALCCYALLTLLAFVVICEQPRPRQVRWSLVLGVLAGSAISTKYPGLLLVAFPAGVALLLRGLFAERSKHAQSDTDDSPHTWKLSHRDLLALGVFCVGVLLAFGPWMFKNFAETGNPVYPLLYSVFGGADWNAELQQKWKDAHPPLGIKNGFVRLFTDLRINLVDVALKSDWQSALLCSFAPLALLCRQNRRWIYWTTGYVVWIWLIWYLFTHRIDRFWLPLLPGLAVLAGIGCHRMLTLCFSSESTILHHFAGASAAGIAVGSVIFNYGLISSSLIGFNGYLLDLPSAIELCTTPSIATIESLKLKNPKVLFVGEAQVFDADFPFEYNTVFDQSLFEEYTSRKLGEDEWDLLPVNEIRENLRQRGFTHLFINWNEILRYRTTYRYTNYVSPQRVRQLVELGILKEVALPPQAQLRSWDSLDASWQQEVDGWGPELKTNFARQQALVQYQLFEILSETD